MRFLSPLLLTSVLVGADGAAPLLSASLPDVQRSIARFNDSIYGVLWNDAKMAPLREQLLSAMDSQAAELGFKVSDVLLGSRNAGVRITAIAAGAAGDPTPVLDFAIDAGALAAPVCAAWRKANTKNEPTDVKGADEAFSFLSAKETFVIARFGNVLTGANQGNAPVAWTPTVVEADATIDCDSRKLFTAVLAATPENQRDEMQSAMAMAEPYLGVTTYRSQITPQGMLERYFTANPCLWLVPVDRTVVDRLPATSMNALAVGIDGKQLWLALKQPVLDLIAKEQGGDETAALAYLDKTLTDAGLTISFTELIEGMTGTFALAIAPGAPFPSLSITIPRTPAMDAVVTLALGFAAAEAPAEGESLIVPIPNLPVPVTLARDAGAWMITSDAMYPTDWLAKTGGFLASPAATLAAERGGAGAVVFGCSDTPTVFRTIIPYMAMGLGQINDLDPAQRQAILQLMQTAAAKAGTGYVVAMPDNGGLNMEMRGLLTYSLVPAIAAAVAIPNLLESRVASNEAAAASMLKSGVFPAEIQFQAGGYVDDNGNGLGDYGFFSEMSGTPIGDDKMELNLLPAAWNEPSPLINGYRFAVYLPDDRDGAVETPDARRTVKGPGDLHFVAYAWPDEEGNGRKMFAITTTGTVYTSDWDGQKPAWNALWGGATSTWKDQPVWKPYRR